MHRTLADGHITDPVEPSKTIYADEDPPNRDATLVRHQEMNALQEEIANVITSEGISLNSPSETIQQMVQLRNAIDTKIASAVAAEAAARAMSDININNLISALNGASIDDDSDFGLSNLQDVLNVIKPAVDDYANISPSVVLQAGTFSPNSNNVAYGKRVGNMIYLNATIAGNLNSSPTTWVKLHLSSMGLMSVGEVFEAAQIFPIVSYLNGMYALKARGEAHVNEDLIFYASDDNGDTIQPGFFSISCQAIIKVQ